MSLERQIRRKLGILNVLKSRATPIGSSDLAAALSAGGHETSERTVRLYLQDMAREGLTLTQGRKGSLITEKGIAELGASQPLERMGIVSARIDQMTYRMDFDLSTRSGTVVVNTTVVDPPLLLRCLDDICQVFRDGYAMGNLVALLAPGERIGDIQVPETQIGFCTVCSITVNGILLKHGIPTRSRFGGLLELRARQPVRFAEMITYEGTSIDPLLVFIRGGMTDYLGAIRTGNGRVGASFREIPTESRDFVTGLAPRMASLGLGGLLRLGMPGQPLLHIPVGEGRCGAIVMGGLNPAAVLEERGHRVFSSALCGLMDYSRLFHFEEIRRRLAALL